MLTQRLVYTTSFNTASSWRDVVLHDIVLTRRLLEAASLWHDVVLGRQCLDTISILYDVALARRRVHKNSF